MSKAVRKAAGFVVYRKNRDEIIEYLLMQASYANHHWTPPKGHLEENESSMDAAIRETDEEAGIKVKDLSVDHNFEKVLKYEPKDKPFTKQVTYWLARLINPETPVVLSNRVRYSAPLSSSSSYLILYIINFPFLLRIIPRNCRSHLLFTNSG